MQWITYTTMGMFFSLLFYVLMGEGILSLATWTNPHLYSWDEGIFLAIALVTFVTAIIGILQAVTGPKIRRVHVEVEGLHPDLHNFCIVQISDLHVGPTIDRAYTERVVSLANSLDADIVALTGDIIDGHLDHLREHVQPLKNLKSRFGNYYVTGNHEYYWNVHDWLPHFNELNFKVLLNRHETCEVGQGVLAIAGVPDLQGHRFDSNHLPDPTKALDGVPANAFKVLLAHQPILYKKAAPAGVDLLLSGHTHGGQFFPFNLFVKLAQPFYKGLYRHGSMWIYTHRGTGYWGPPIRFGVKAEVTQLRLLKK